MAVIEKSGFLKYKDAQGNTNLMYPITTKDNVDGMDEIDAHVASQDNPHNVTADQIGAISYSAQSLNNGQQYQARKNIGAAEEYHTHPYMAIETKNAALPWYDCYGKTVITYGDNKFVALNNESVAYSTDGLSWSQNESDWLATDSWGGIAYGDGVFVIVPSAYQDRQGYRYHDGTWDSFYMPYTDDESNNDSYCDWTSVTYGNGKFVAVGNNSSSTYGCIAWSVDGNDWTRLSGDVIEQNIWTHIVYGNDIFMAWSANNQCVYYSTDGLTWTQGTAPEMTGYNDLLFYANNEFIHLTYGGVSRSTDGLSWATRNNYDVDQPVAMAYGNGKYVVIRADVRVAVSSDLINWEVSESPLFDFGWGSDDTTTMVYGDGKFVVVNHGYLAVSTDGVNWNKEYTALAQNGADVTEAARKAIQSQPDWNQTDETKSDFVKNRPFGIVYGDTLTWDGNREGLVRANDYEQYLISESTPTIDDFVNGASNTKLDGDTETSTNLEMHYAIYEAGDGAIVVGNSIVALKDGATVGNTIYPKKGMYFTWIGNDCYTTSLTIPGYTGFPSVKKIDEKYLPNLTRSYNTGILTGGTSSAYTATIEGITELEPGISFIMIPHATSSKADPTLNVNNLGAKPIWQRLSTATSSIIRSADRNWLYVGSPITVTYDGHFWVAELTRPDASTINGVVPVENGGVPSATTADNGKFLRVVNGSAAWTTVSSAEGVSF